MEINLSKHTRIKLLDLNDYIHLSLFDLMVAKISRTTLKGLIKKELRIPGDKIAFSKQNEDFIIIIPDDIIDVSKEIFIRNLMDLLSSFLPPLLRNKYTKRGIIYITENSQIPLMGSIYFGIIDRGTNLIQVRPITGCILNCPFCSVDEGPFSQTRITDYIISAPYLIAETVKVIDYKNISDIEIHIDGQCEPTLYPHLPALISELSKDSRIGVISMQTNGIPLNEAYIQKLEKAGLNRINLSINSINPKTARHLAGNSDYNTKQIKQIAKQIAESSIELLVAPVWIPGVNDSDIEEIISFVTELHQKTATPLLGIQNYLKYKFGRKVKGVKQVNMNKFREKLRGWEEKFQITPLFLSKRDFGMHSAKRCPKIHHKGEKIEVEIVLPGRIVSKSGIKREMIGKAKNRLIHIINSGSKVGDFVLAKIISDKDNIYHATEISS